MMEYEDMFDENGKMVFLTEGGCYHAACSTEAKSEMAEEFRDWLCDEVCVSIRKNGMYILPPNRHVEFLELIRRSLDKANMNS